jgi:hypothetical protein
MTTATKHIQASERQFAMDWCVGGYRAQTINPPSEALV